MKQFFLYIITALCVFFTPILGLIICVGFAIVFDTITGILKAVKVGGWVSVTSRNLSQIISKMVLYQGCLLLLYTMDFHLLNELSKHFISVPFFATKLTCVLLLFIEMVSVKENIEIALNVNIWQLLKIGINRAKELKDDFNNLKD